MLASLTAEEIAFAAAATRARLAPSALTFYDISLLESFTSAQKEHLLRTRDESALPRRRARVVVSEREFQRVTVLDVPVSRFDSRPPVCTPRPMVLPGLTGEEYALFERLVKEYEPFRVACRERGVERTPAAGRAHAQQHVHPLEQTGMFTRLEPPSRPNSVLFVPNLPRRAAHPLGGG